MCANFYGELMNPKFPNRFESFLIKNKLLGENMAAMRSALEMSSDKMKHVVVGRGSNGRGHSGLFKGTVKEEMLHDEHMPSAPLRAFSYTQAGGKQSCGDKPNAVFACAPLLAVWPALTLSKHKHTPEPAPNQVPRRLPWRLAVRRGAKQHQSGSFRGPARGRGRVRPRILGRDQVGV